MLENSSTTGNDHFRLPYQFIVDDRPDVRLYRSNKAQKRNISYIAGVVKLLEGKNEQLLVLLNGKQWLLVLSNFQYISPPTEVSCHTMLI